MSKHIIPENIINPQDLYELYYEKMNIDLLIPSPCIPPVTDSLFIIIKITDPEQLLQWMNSINYRHNDIDCIKITNHDIKFENNGKLHFTDGPAHICRNGKQSWYLHGHLHRPCEQGYAIIHPSQLYVHHLCVSYYNNNKQIGIGEYIHLSHYLDVYYIPKFEAILYLPNVII